MAEMMSFRVPTRTRLQMDRLSSRYHSMTAVVVAAVDRLYQQEVGNMAISERHEASTAQMRVVRTIGDAKVGYIATTIGEVAAVRYADGTMFTSGDWDSPQPNLTDDGDILDAWWVDADGRDAMMLDGLPRLAPWATTEEDRMTDQTIKTIDAVHAISDAELWDQFAGDMTPAHLLAQYDSPADLGVHSAGYTATPEMAAYIQQRLWNYALESLDNAELLDARGATFTWREAAAGEWVWCLSGVNRDGNAWETDDYQAESEEAARKAAADYLRDYLRADD
jgi:hypothetical protein